jgi:excisionase family DNA binding protein
MSITDRSRRLLTIEEAADYLAMSTRTLRRKIEAGELAAHQLGRVWRISREDLAAFLARHRKA